MKKNLLFQVSLVLLLVFFASCTNTQENIPSETRIVLGTVCTISLYDNGTQEIYDELFLRLQEIENLMSVNIADSEISMVNASSGKEKVEVSYDTYTVLTKALEYANATQGAFNPAIGPLVSMWAIGTDNARVPDFSEIESAIQLADWEKVRTTSEDNTYFVYLEETGMALDLGGIAKGYAADEMVSILKSHGIESAIIDLGGNIYAVGEKAGGDSWRVGIKNPFNSTGSPAVRLDVKNSSVVTSGVYERFFEKNDIRYHHLLDYKTGYPVNNNLMSVTIVTESSMLADVLSTAVFILGQEQGIALLNSLGEKGFCINAESEVTSTGNLRSDIVLLDNSFTLQ